MSAEDMFSIVEKCFGLFGNLPEGPIRLNDHTLINDPAKFVDGHCQMVFSNLGRPLGRPYAERLQVFLALIGDSPEGETGTVFDTFAQTAPL